MFILYSVLQRSHIYAIVVRKTCNVKGGNSQNSLSLWLFGLNLVNIPT